MADYTALKGKKVTVTTGGEAVEGLLEEASEIGIVFKPKNSSRSLLIESKDIESIVETSAGPKKLKARVLPQVGEGKYRLHLIERHGYPLADIEAMTEEAAEAFHNGLDHSVLGHTHREPSAAEAAIAEAEAAE